MILTLQYYTLEKACEKTHCKVSVCTLRCKFVEKQISITEDEFVIYKFWHTEWREFCNIIL
jgi:hypothetical protein